MAEAVELNEEMSSDEIKDFAAQVAEEVEQERKSDAEIVADNSPEPKPETKKTTAEENSGETAKAESQGEESGNESQSAEWLTDDIKAEVATYGIDEAELADFANREELDRALRLIDKRTLEAGRKAMAEGEGRSRNEKGQFVKDEPQEDQQSSDDEPSSDRYEVQLSEDLYDEEIIDEFKRLQDHYDSRLKALESHLYDANAKAEEERFDSYVDTLKMPELFGKTGEETDEELEKREDLLVSVKTWMTGLEQHGRSAEMSQKLVERVANMVFSEEIGKKKLKQRTRKLSKQHNLRQGGSPVRPLPPGDDPREAADRLYKELDRA